VAISDIEAFTHLSEADIDSLADELDAIRQDVTDSLGERDARYIHRTIAAQRGLEVAGRLLLAFGSKRSAWLAGTATLALAKIIENMEIGHNVIHGQWDWMNDPEIHSATWEWDMTAAAKHWRATHNFSHHTYTNILGMDDDVGYGILRVTRDEPWRPYNVGNLFFNTMLAVGFEWGIGLQHLQLRKAFDGPEARAAAVTRVREFSAKTARQVVKDYLAYPALTALSPRAGFGSTVKANLVAGLIRNVWANAVIFCGHFPDGADKFALSDLDGERKGHWYLRQMLGSANIDAGPVMAFMTGNLSYQIEHHLYPDLPSYRLAEISVKVRALCEKYDLPYTSGPMLVQYAKTWRTIAKLSLPDRFLRDTADDAPETRSERMFASLGPEFAANDSFGFDSLSGGRRGLNTAVATVRRWRAARTASATPR
jgi:linoleoyl-CoA desaturase